MNNVESLLERCHGEKTHFSRNEGRTFSLSQMNNVESLPEHCHGDKTHFSRNEKRTFGMASLPVGHNARCCLPTQIASALCAWCLQNFSWLYGLKQRYGAVSNRNRLYLLAWQFVSISPSIVVVMSAETPSSLKTDNPRSVPSFGMKRWQIKEKILFL